MPLIGPSSHNIPALVSTYGPTALAILSWLAVRVLHAI
jgi:hypothetical protein